MPEPKPADAMAGEVPSFKPLWWLRGGHAQTILGSQWPQRLPKERAMIRRVDLDDGDAVAVADERHGGAAAHGVAGGFGRVPKVCGHATFVLPLLYPRRPAGHHSAEVCGNM